MKDVQSFIGGIKEKQMSLPKKPQKICDYLLKHYRDVPFQSVQTIADKTNTSATSVLRLIQSLGYKRFGDFQNEIREILLLGTPDVFSFRFSNPVSPENGSLAFIMESIQSDLQNNLNDINMKAFDSTVSLFEHSRKIAFLGLRSSAFVAEYMHSMMGTYRDDCVLLAGDGSEYIYDKLQFIDSRDVLFAVSMGGPNHTIRTIDAIKHAKDSGVPIVLMTSTATNAAIDYADHFFIAAPSNYLSVVSALSIVDALLFEFFKRNKGLIDNSEISERLIKQNILMG